MSKFAWSWFVIMCALVIALGAIFGPTSQLLSSEGPIATIRGWVAHALDDGPRLTGIAISDHGCAVIGGTLVHEGSVIGEAKVVKIEKNRVHFEKDGTRWTEVVGSPPASGRT